MNDCGLDTCRYNENGKCTNEEKRKECVEVSRKVLCVERSDIMADLKKIELEIVEKAKTIAKEIAKGNDVYITKSASGVVIKKMTVGKV